MLACEDDSVSDSIHCIIVRLEITEQGWATIVSFWVPASVFYSTDELLSSVLVVCVQCSKTIMESKNGGFEEDCVFHFGPGFSVPCFVFWVGGSNMD